MSKRTHESGFTLIETLMVVGMIGVITAIAVPMFASTMAGFKLSGNARSLSNAVAVAKMRAASNFSRTRIFVDLTARTHQLETWNKTTLHWTSEGGVTSLSQGVTFSYGVVGEAPPSTQGTIAQAVECTTDAGVAIAHTACVTFNSRGVPVDALFAPTGDAALYLTDGTAVYGVTIAATGMVRMWRTRPDVTPSWVLN